MEINELKRLILTSLMPDPVVYPPDKGLNKHSTGKELNEANRTQGLPERVREEIFSRDREKSERSNANRLS